MTIKTERPWIRTTIISLLFYCHIMIKNTKITEAKMSNLQIKILRLKQQENHRIFLL